MSTTTENLGLVKPGYDDPADVAVINENFDAIDEELANDAALVSGAYAGRDLAEAFAGEIAGYADEAAWLNARVMSGDVSGIRPFDYFDITLTDGKVFRYRCAAYDPYYGAGDAEIAAHHVIMVPDQVWPDPVPWNTTSTNQGTASEKHPYLASNLHKWEANTFWPLLPAKWRAVIATHRALLEERYSASGALTSSTTWSWADMGKVWSLSETEVYGEVVWGTQGYSKGCDCHFSTFFALTRHRIRRNHGDARHAWWLRGAGGGNATHACIARYNGIAYSYGASDAGARALPCFRVGV